MGEHSHAPFVLRGRTRHIIKILVDSLLVWGTLRSHNNIVGITPIPAVSMRTNDEGHTRVGFSAINSGTYAFSMEDVVDIQVDIKLEASKESKVRVQVVTRGSKVRVQSPLS